MSCKRIRLVVKDSADESSYVPVLEAAGYVQQIREPDWFEHRLFKRPDTDINLEEVKAITSLHWAGRSFSSAEETLSPADFRLSPAVAIFCTAVAD